MKAKPQIGMEDWHHGSLLQTKYQVLGTRTRIRGRLDRQKRRRGGEENHVKTETEIGVMLP